MLIIIRSKVDPETLKKIAEDLKGYIQRLSRDVHMDADWAEAMLTWANILTH